MSQRWIFFNEIFVSEFTELLLLKKLTFKFVI